MLLPSLNQGFTSDLLKAANIPQTYTHHGLFVQLLKRTAPLRVGNVYRSNPQAMSLCILDQRCRAVESHRLIVEQCRCECGQIADFQEGAGVSDQRKAGRMA